MYIDVCYATFPHPTYATRRCVSNNWTDGPNTPPPPHPPLPPQVLPLILLLLASLFSCIAIPAPDPEPHFLANGHSHSNIAPSYSPTVVENQARTRNPYTPQFLASSMAQTYLPQHLPQQQGQQTQQQLYLPQQQLYYLPLQRYFPQQQSQQYLHHQQHITQSQYLPQQQFLLQQ